MKHLQFVLSIILCMATTSNTLSQASYEDNNNNLQKIIPRELAIPTSPLFYLRSTRPASDGSATIHYFRCKYSL